MKIQICIAALILICSTSTANAAHGHGEKNNCWYDTKYPGNGWGYYYCGNQENVCYGKKSMAHDTVFWQYHGDSFTFDTAPSEKYWCCGGTKNSAGQYVRSDTWITNTTTQRVTKSNGTCTQLVQTNVCGETQIVDCTEPDTCSQGFIMRNKECIKPCDKDEVFESPSSNTCIACSELHQGPSKDYQSCIQCDQYTEFFNRQTKQCIKKSGLKQYSKQTMKECWRCPNNVMLKCMEAVSLADKMGKTGPARLQEIRNTASFDGTDIVKACHME